jgi:hypothetical protein
MDRGKGNEEGAALRTFSQSRRKENSFALPD